MSDTKLVRCNYMRVGPKLGYNLVAWRQPCKRKVRVPVEQKTAYCWQHGGRDE